MLPLFLGLNAANVLILLLAALGASAEGTPSRLIAALATHHASVGVFSAFLAALTHSVTLTYFMATTKWLEAAALKADLDRETYVAQARAAKSRVLMHAVTAIGITFAAIFSGAATDVASAGTAFPVHRVAAVAALVGNVFAAVVLFRHVRQRGRNVRRALAAVDAYVHEPAASPGEPPGRAGCRLLAAMAWTTTLAVAQPSDASTDAPTSRPATSQPATSQPATDPEVLDWLTRIEAAHDAITSLGARITYDRNQLKLGDRQRRTGTLVYSAGPPARFAIHFRHLKVNRRRMERNRWYVFDGRFFIERLDDQKQFFRRELVPPGEAVDRVPLAMGEGPFLVPLPLRKERLLSRFDVTLVAPEPNATEDLIHLRLIPRNGRRVEVRRIEVWHEKERLLPVKVMTLDRSHYESVVRVDLDGLQLNEPIADDIFRATAPEGPDWLVEEIPYLPPSAGEAGRQDGDEAAPETSDAPSPGASPPAEGD